MDVLFLHPNFPGQFSKLALALANTPEYRVWGLGNQKWVLPANPVSGVTTLMYSDPEAAPEGVHPWAAPFEKAVRTGEQVLRALGEHKKNGLEPDVIVAHPGWGDAFFVRDFFPGVKVIGLFEYFYRARGADVGFDPEFPSSLNDIFRLHASNATQLMALESCDVGICATEWQRSRYPKAYREQLMVLHEGVDTNTVCPDPLAELSLPNGQILRAGDEVLTYVSRHLEPYRGFHVLMRALPEILRKRPHVQVLVVGEPNGTSYGQPPAGGSTWKAKLLAEVHGELDQSRVHFLGSLPYEKYLKVLQVSAVHIYLTYPFVLSWSLLEAMSAACLVVGSDTAPVQEVIEHGEQGLLCDFLNPVALTRTVVYAMENRQDLHHLRTKARQSMVDGYDFDTVTLPKYLELMEF